MIQYAFKVGGTIGYNLLIAFIGFIIFAAVVYAHRSLQVPALPQEEGGVEVRPASRLLKKDAALRRPVRSGGRGVVFQQPPRTRS